MAFKWFYVRHILFLSCVKWPLQSLTCPICMSATSRNTAWDSERRCEALTQHNRDCWENGVYHKKGIFAADRLQSMCEHQSHISEKNSVTIQIDVWRALQRGINYFQRKTSSSPSPPHAVFDFSLKDLTENSLGNNHTCRESFFSFLLFLKLWIPRCFLSFSIALLQLHWYWLCGDLHKGSKNFFWNCRKF